MTYTSLLDISQSILDLTFTTSKTAKNIVDWAINDEIMTRSNHKVIAFNVLSKNVQKVDNLLNTFYNVQKADWTNFIKNLQLNHASAKVKMQTLNQSLNIENMNKIIMLLRLTIENAINENISERRLCNQSKV